MSNSLICDDRAALTAQFLRCRHWGMQSAAGAAAVTWRRDGWIINSLRYHTYKLLEMFLLIVSSVGSLASQRDHFSDEFITL